MRFAAGHAKNEDLIKGKARKKGKAKVNGGPSREQRTRELLLALYAYLSEGWKIYPKSTLGTGPETILQRVAELLREFANKK